MYIDSEYMLLWLDAIKIGGVLIVTQSTQPFVHVIIGLDNGLSSFR